MKKGTKSYFVGNTRVPKPVNHGFPPEVVYALVKQSGLTIKEWNGQQWVDLHTNDLRTFRSKNGSR